LPSVSSGRLTPSSTVNSKDILTFIKRFGILLSVTGKKSERRMGKTWDPVVRR